MLRFTPSLFLTSATLLLLAAFCGPGLAAADIEYSSIDQLPAPVQATLKQEARGAPLTKFEKEERNGVVTYTAEIQGAKAGTIVELYVTADGKLLKSETEDIAGDVPASAATITTLGDLAAFRTLGVETLKLIAQNDIKAAAARITELESAWDKAENVLRAKNGADWKILDKAIDKALAQVRAEKPDTEGCTKALKTMIGLCPIPASSGK